MTGLALTGGGVVWTSCSDPTASDSDVPVINASVSNKNGTTVFVVYRGHTSSVNGVAWSPNGKRIVSGSSDGTAQTWDAITGKNIVISQAKAKLSPYVDSVAWSPDGSRIAFGDGETVQIVNAATAHHTFTYAPSSDGFVSSLAWSHDGSRIASVGSDNNQQVIRVWNARTGKTLLTYHGHNRDINALAWSPDDKWIVSSDNNKQVQIWNAASGNKHLIHTGYGEHDIVKSVAWSPDGKQIVSGSDNYTARVWDVATGQTHLTYSKHSSGVWGVAWSPDGKRIASAGAYPDSTVQLWDAKTGGNVFVYRGHSPDDAVLCVAWSPNGKMIASGSLDHTVQVWQAK
ncbi:hypothetical protein KSD_56980 [Ktedonobacter sp. SOSP1-85]|nr:hypothetical protein KSC_068560 [Ktedonobacter sp. SOSP1-52]GHO68384.1 hypothetical protein KSC_072760 [Ktedonobacter sp. SOSP1-52]GHO77927.1 hypothetical protein KSD_56980 [Ktedonobacter sp. SOSP1-85]